ncbi:DUF2624 family protein [Gracilibacillus sp. YIM 98692]|uniref:DUF2624 family protein n=1 Tax=Gracilibacillus sp. YIM 98692 TaxID=2663532 RepID=UPI001F0954BA|nr:DUF2624 family protein [Gracilibacillus sp. YIM 98692]
MMNGFSKKLVQKKLQQLTADQLYQYAHQYNISINKQQAQVITNQLKSNHYDPTSAEDRAKMFKKLAQITDIQTAQTCQKLFQQLIKDYGVEDLFT